MGNNYPDDLFDGMFDEVVISGQVGMRKPDAEIYHHTIQAIGLSAPECAFVDDLLPNVLAARELRTGRDPPHRLPDHRLRTRHPVRPCAVALSTSRAQLTRRPRPPALPDVPVCPQWDNANG